MVQAAASGEQEQEHSELYSNVTNGQRRPTALRLLDANHRA